MNPFALLPAPFHGHHVGPGSGPGRVSRPHPLCSPHPGREQCQEPSPRPSLSTLGCRNSPSLCPTQGMASPGTYPAGRDGFLLPMLPSGLSRSSWAG